MLGLGYDWKWFNEPVNSCDGKTVTLTTGGETDFWQRTHYGFRRDNAHALLAKVEKDITLSLRCSFKPTGRYDQGGVLVRLDSENWLKISIETESDSISRLGSVATNLGYSDWATKDIDASILSIYYRLSIKGSDLLVEYSEEGSNWTQMRITHMHAHKDHFYVGLYACSPTAVGGATFTFDSISIGPSIWVDE